ncbi:hypothetical protein GQ44DRAFT_699691 [Phaeosphaeriaceae sp. PMI808]|nr:hypothetical protein GQ44DRAFT_699691 [Phaeosphaeriaceae sp. PMI808]
MRRIIALLQQSDLETRRQQSSSGKTKRLLSSEHGPFLSDFLRRIHFDGEHTGLDLSAFSYGVVNTK